MDLVRHGFCIAGIMRHSSGGWQNAVGLRLEDNFVKALLNLSIITQAEPLCPQVLVVVWVQQPMGFHVLKCLCAGMAPKTVLCSAFDACTQLVSSIDI